MSSVRNELVDVSDVALTGPGNSPPSSAKASLIVTRPKVLENEDPLERLGDLADVRVIGSGRRRSRSRHLPREENRPCE